MDVPSNFSYPREQEPQFKEAIDWLQQSIDIVHPAVGKLPFGVLAWHHLLGFRDKVSEGLCQNFQVLFVARLVISCSDWLPLLHVFLGLSYGVLAIECRR